MSDHDNSLNPTYGIGSIVAHKNFGNGKILGYSKSNYEILFSNNTYKLISFDSDSLSLISRVGDASIDKVSQALREVLEDYGFLEVKLEMAQKWIGGKLVMQPGKEGIKPKEIPIEAFFKKITGVREKLRVLEQKINNHPKLDEEEKMELQGYLTRSYGSLTSFNVLFQNKESHFVGVKTTDESSDNN